MKTYNKKKITTSTVPLRPIITTLKILHSHKFGLFYIIKQRACNQCQVVQILSNWWKEMSNSLQKFRKSIKIMLLSTVAVIFPFTYSRHKKMSQWWPFRPKWSIGLPSPWPHTFYSSRLGCKDETRCLENGDICTCPRCVFINYYIIHIIHYFSLP